MEEIKHGDVEFVRRLNRHPNLKARMEVLLNTADAAIEAGEMTADEAEIQLREQVRALGQNVLQDWAISKERIAASAAAENSELKRHGKKNSIGIQPLEKCP